MTTTITNNSMRRSLVEADTAFIYLARQVTDLRHFTMRFYDEQGNHKSTLTADRGLYHTGSDELDARGHVVVTTTDGSRLTTTHLIYAKQRNQIRVDTAFVYDSAKEHGSGDGLTSDVDFKNVRVDRPRGFQRGRGFLLPGQ
jgi:LPS export ABC transporter protein LptC